MSGDVRAARVCDFCLVALTAGAWSIPVRRVRLFLADDDGRPTVPLIDYGGDGWAACEACAAMVEAGDADELAAHVLASLARRGVAEPMAEGMMRALYRVVLEERTGPAVWLPSAAQH